VHLSLVVFVLEVQTLLDELKLNKRTYYFCLRQLLVTHYGDLSSHLMCVFADSFSEHVPISVKPLELHDCQLDLIFERGHPVNELADLIFECCLGSCQIKLLLLL